MATSDLTAWLARRSPRSVFGSRRQPSGIGPQPIPLAWQDEGGDAYWGEGHIDPAAFVLATVVDVAECCGPTEAMEHLLGWTDPARTVADLAPFDHAGARKTVQDLVDDVQHVWFYEDPTNEEVWHLCRADHPFANPVTKLAL